MTNKVFKEAFNSYTAALAEGQCMIKETFTGHPLQPKLRLQNPGKKQWEIMEFMVN